ncbi:MAG: hypothetical protein GF308_05085 [Candidatus Heimdallarchaeota archaeon]|nr:hypothetical protein [Candidatus Heimdallarchaeota archaeon]
MAKDLQVKNYKIVMFRKPLTLKHNRFEVEIRAVNQGAALEKALSRIGSKHSIPRQLLKVQSITEIPEEKLKNPILRELALNDEIKL